jgi:hypothetical protein
MMRLSRDAVPPGAVEGFEPATNPLSEQTANRYVVVMRAWSGFYFGNGDPLPTMRFGTELGPVEVAVRTHRSTVPGFTNPRRSGLVAEARGHAPSLQRAVEVFANFTRGLAAVLSVAANAPVGHFTADIVFEDTPGKREREYYRRSVPADPDVPSPGRRLDSALTLALIGGWMRIGPEKRLERWNRAAAQYHHALQEWEPGAEIPATNRLWVGMEALTPIALEQHLASESLTRDQLLNRWGVGPEALNAEVRRRLLFQGDDDCYGTAQKARNEALHGHAPTWQVRERALETRNRTAAYLRTALIRSAGLGRGVEAVLLAPPYDRPFHWSVIQQMFGRIVSDGDEIARPEDLYPRIDWMLVPVELPPDAEGDAGIAFRPFVRPRLAKGASFRLDGVQLLLPVVDPADPAPSALYGRRPPLGPVLRRALKRVPWAALGLARGLQARARDRLSWRL